MSKSFWIWNGTSYDVYDDATPSMTGTLKVFQSLFVKTLAGSNGHTLHLLIPAAPSTTGQALPVPTEHLAQGKLPWYLGWLDWVVPPRRRRAAARPRRPCGAEPRPRLRPPVVAPHAQRNRREC
ncbi:hypothetical protein [Methylococcus mesophilus]|uniref:hypothetical protein n=1 Tax=Methylococcus mesophilus TaxID=2993564 RepID=UPI00224AA8DD|nr:hypothetical protein [Methylococcus mesophilus]UZR28696.1 hypothetical protein OOT43_18600 [Methylococcus mesophilus]